jgi:hypothetical protein
MDSFPMKTRVSSEYSILMKSGVAINLIDELRGIF